jgi:hypothetical protein
LANVARRYGEWREPDAVPVKIGQCGETLHAGLEPFPDSRDFFRQKQFTDSEIDSTIELEVNVESRSVRLLLKADWFRGFYRPDNYAERLLGQNVLLGASKLFGVKRSPEELRTLVLKAAGSTDFRHRHAFAVERVIEQLSADGLTGPFDAIPLSAGALAKCGAAWHVHPRDKGVRIIGKVDCLAFLKEFVDDSTSRLLADLRQYNRRQLVAVAMQGLQASLAEEGHWRRSARALRAIHGVEKDFAMSMTRVMAANAVLRANSMLVELAAEAKAVGGISIGKMDLEDLQARAVQLFQIADTYPAYVTDRIEPEIHLSPTGDILFSHEFHEAVIQRSAKKRHARERADSSNEYVARFERNRLEHTPKQGFSSAIQAEYGVPFRVYQEFADATAILARNWKKGVFVLKQRAGPGNLNKTISGISA